MKRCTKYFGEMTSFLFQQKYSTKIATICSSEEAEFTVRGIQPIHIKLCDYDMESIMFFMNQALEWKIIMNHAEDWDPYVYSKNHEAASNSVLQINTNQLLIENGNFVGVIDYSKDLGDRYDLFCAFTKDYVGKPIAFKYTETYGSSDKDMYTTQTYYLVRDDFNK